MPAVHKIGQGGYDGKGVQLLLNTEDFKKGFDAPSVLEKKINIKKEIAIIVAMNEAGETVLYPPAEMIFDPVLNLLDYQVSPAVLAENITWKIEAIAIKVVRELKSHGLFAIELFIDMNDEVLEMKPLPAYITAVIIRSKPTIPVSSICCGESCLVIHWAIQTPYSPLLL